MAKIYKFPSGEVIESVETNGLDNVLAQLKALEADLRSRKMTDAADSIQMAIEYAKASEVCERAAEEQHKERMAQHGIL